MKLTYIVAILLYVIFFARLFGSKNKPAEILLFSVIAAPGISVGGTIFNLADVAIPLVFLWLFVAEGKRLRFGKIEKLYSLYVAAIFVSILTNLLSAVSFLRSFLQALRVGMVLLCAASMRMSEAGGPDGGTICHLVNVYGLMLSCITIVAFLEQGTIYDSTQYMTLGGREIHRAGGVFGESSALGATSLFLLISALWTDSGRSAVRKRTAVAGGVFAAACNVLSYTRITNLMMIAVLAAAFFQRFSLKKLYLFLALVFAGAMGVAFVPFLRAFVFERMLKILDFSQSFDELSSGRLFYWRQAWNAYLACGNPVFGAGYKNGFFADNNYLMALTQMGLFGLFADLFFVAGFLIASFRTRGAIPKLLALSVVVLSLTNDILNSYRPISLMMVLAAPYFAQKETRAERAEPRGEASLCRP